MRKQASGFFARAASRLPKNKTTLHTGNDSGEIFFAYKRARRPASLALLYFVSSGYLARSCFACKVHRALQLAERKLVRCERQDLARLPALAQLHT